ncbi:hypothetical protein JAO73_10620 [Hymenobacter sp. BT523]|uniref:hypothetical protein n=1 Tax=Hymenobacter sp. BT523 TaxID=2795725 RepID=UPI0018ECB50A|nr:hypothetical protein [Hymenobacter sp. BT523]MBJ6109469.1 hypothetical protein [Hymenobacter sp. BT523]
MLLLSTLGCSKKADSPPPAMAALEGSWNPTQSVATTYNNAGVQIDQQTYNNPPGNTNYTTFTSTTMQLFTSGGVGVTGPQPYTRSGNTLTFEPSNPLPPYTIRQLTATELTLFQVVPGSFQKGHTDYETHYTRR